MTEQAKPVVDPLDQNCDDIDITYPILPAANYPLRIKEAVVSPNKKKQENPDQDGAGDNLVVSWETTQTHVDLKRGEPIPAGLVVLKQHISITPTAKYSRNDIAKAITKVVRAVKMPNVKPSQVIGNPEALKGKMAVVKVGVRQATAQFQEGNEILSLVIEG